MYSSSPKPPPYQSQTPMYISQAPVAPIKFSSGIVVQSIPPLRSSRRMGESSTLLPPPPSSLLSSFISYFFNFCPFIFLLVVLILSFWVLLLFVPHGRDLEGGVRSLKGITNNYELAPIKTLSTISASSSACPSSQVLLPIFSYEGTKLGCLCEGSSRLYSRGYCWANEGRCSIVNNIEGKEIYVWKGRKICVERYPSDSFNFLPPSESCPASFRRCHSSLCLLSSLPCPISKVTTTLEPENPTTLRTFENTPILKFEVSLSNYPCTDEKRRSLSFSGKSYPGLRKGWEGCGEYGNVNQWSNKIDENTQSLFYSENQINVEELPYWNYFQRIEDKFNIFSIHRIKASDEEKCKGTRQKIGSVTTKFSDKILRAAFWMARIDILFCLIGIFFAIGMLFCIQCKIFSLHPFGSQISHTIQIVCCFITGLFSIILCSVYFNHLEEISEEEKKHDIISRALKNDCFGENRGLIKAANVLENHYGESDSEVFGIVCSLFAWSVLGFILWGVFFLLKKKSIRHEE